jgi:hypothetical protein
MPTNPYEPPQGDNEGEKESSPSRELLVFVFILLAVIAVTGWLAQPEIASSPQKGDR